MSEQLAPLVDPVAADIGEPGVLFLGQLRRDLRLAFGQPSELVNPIAFFVVVVALFPLGVSPEASVLGGLAAGAIWIAALLATLMGLEALFRRDLDDGTLEHLVLAARPLYLAVLARLLAHWLVSGLPLTLLPLPAWLLPARPEWVALFLIYWTIALPHRVGILTGLGLGIMLNLPEAARWPLCCGLLLGTPILTLLGGVGAALTVGLRSGGVLLALLVLPLYLPVLILGVSSATLAVDGLDTTGQLMWLAAGLALAVTTLPFAIAGALRIGVEAG